MTRSAVLDISAFIWDVNHFNTNKPKYFELMQVLPNLVEGLVKYKVPVVMRQQLMTEINAYFPYDLYIPNDYYSFQLLSLYFFTQISPYLIDYEANDNSIISSKPGLTKKHFNASTNTEIRYLVTHLHTDDAKIKIFLTFDIVWNYADHLETSNKNKKVIKTLICDNTKLHETILKYFRKIFEHNPKHNAIHSDDYISALSCYNERLGNTTNAQKLLDESVKYKDNYYCYDSDNKVYVKFVRTTDNIYHGYDVRLPEDDLIKIRKTFNK